MIQLSTLMEETLFSQGEVLKALIDLSDVKKLHAALTLTESIETPSLDSLPLESEDTEEPDFTYFSEIEAIVAEFRLPSEIENYLWSYPVYRRLTECSLSPSLKIGVKNIQSLIDEITTFGRHWIHFLAKRIDPPIKKELQGTLEHTWIRFQTRVLEKSGQSRFRVI